MDERTMLMVMIKLTKNHYSSLQVLLVLLTALLLLLLSSSSSWLRVEAFTLVAPPRFDVCFAEKIVGSSWSVILSDGPSNDDRIIWNVEDLMRSCGGAVQGIREVP
jgi:hypothetical protein